MTLPLIYDLDLTTLRLQLDTWGQPAYRAVQLWQGLYQKFWNSPEQFTNFPTLLRIKIAENYTFKPLTPSTVL